MKTNNLSPYVLALTLCGLISCSAPQSKYEKAIADFVQTDQKGVWTDLKFKVIEMGEPQNVTISDSIRILSEAFEADKTKKIAFATECIERNRQSLEKEKLPTLRKFHQDYIDKQQTVVDSLSDLTVTLPDVYTSKASTEVVAKEVVCKFSIVYPGYNTTQEIFETFVLNAIGDKCYHRKIRK